MHGLGPTPTRDSPAPGLDGQHADGAGTREVPGGGADRIESAVRGAAAVHPGGAVSIPIRTGTGLNEREHWRARARRVKSERQATALFLRGNRPALPCTVLLTRVGPSNGLDDDNLRGSLKAVRDQVAQWLGVDDRSPLVAWTYAQRRAKEWGVEVNFA